MKRRQSRIRKKSGDEIISAIPAVEARLVEIKVPFYDFVLAWVFCTRLVKRGDL